MRLSINEGYFRKIYGTTGLRDYLDSIKLCKAGGFDTIDFTLGKPAPEDNPILREDYLREAQRIRAYCDSLDMSVNQTHARLDYFKLAKEEYMAQMIKTVQVSSILGADCVVVHADTYRDPNGSFDFEKALRAIYEVYAPMVEEAKKQGIRIAMETMFESWAPKGKRARFTSYIEELDAIVSLYNDPVVGICWDFGHAGLSYADQQFEQMKKVGSKIIATHIHDNFQKADLHLMPFFGKTDWEQGMSVLKECGYQGDLTFELVFGALPEPLILDYVKLNYKFAQYLRSRFDAY